MGSILNPTPLTNGTSYSFDGSASDNYYSFTLNSDGNVLVSGSDGNNNYIVANIYNSNLAKVKTLVLQGGSESELLSAGDYFFQPIDSDGGSFSLSSTAMNGTPILATPLTNGTSYSFDGSASDNYYSFTLNSDGNVLVSGSDGNNNYIVANIYNSNLAKVKTLVLQGGSESELLSAGDYFFQPIDSDGGSFSLSSTAMSSVNTAKLIDADGNLWDSTIDVGDGTYILPAAAQLYRSYFGAMGRLPDEGGYNWWLGEIETGRHTLNSMAAGFIDSSEFKALSDSDNSGVISNEEFILHMYNGVFGRDPDAGGLAWWVGQLDTEAKTQPDAFISMTQSNEYVELTVGTVADMMFS